MLPLHLEPEEHEIGRQSVEDAHLRDATKQPRPIEGYNSMERGKAGQEGFESCAGDAEGLDGRAQGGCCRNLYHLGD